MEKGKGEDNRGERRCPLFPFSLNESKHKRGRAAFFSSSLRINQITHSAGLSISSSRSVLVSAPSQAACGSSSEHMLCASKSASTTARSILEVQTLPARATTTTTHHHHHHPPRHLPRRQLPPSVVSSASTSKLPGPLTACASFLWERSVSSPAPRVKTEKQPRHKNALH